MVFQFIPFHVRLDVVFSRLEKFGFFSGPLAFLAFFFFVRPGLPRHFPSYPGHPLLGRHHPSWASEPRPRGFPAAEVFFWFLEL